MIGGGFVPRGAVPLAPATSLQLGGSAEFFACIEHSDELTSALAWAEQRALELRVLGGGSNVVIADAGLRGLVLTLGLAEETSTLEGDQVLVTIGAGAAWDDFVARCVARGWSGIECLSGIPGQVGATPIQNVGAYGQEVADTLRCVRAYDRERGCAVELSHAECEFGYRTSRLKAREAGRFIVLDVSFRLRVGGPPCLAYPEIARHFAAGDAPSLARARDVVLATRREKSMLLDPADPNGRSCGSFFLNPILSAEQLDALRARTPTAPPVFPQPDGRFKLPAAWLIERAGFHKGERWGAVGISTRHSLALVAHPGATSRQLLEAAHRIRDGVARALGIQLSPEPQFLGFGSAPHDLPPL